MEPITPESTEAQSADLVADNIAQLKALFPELVTGAADGASVNVDVLKQLVGDQTISDVDEKYGLNWHGKRAARKLALTPSLGTLRPCPEESKDWDTTQNLFIEGDNLEVLKLLQKSYAGKVKLIYIDPPYNTGKDFVYPDNFKDNIRNYKELTGQLDGEGRDISTNKEASGRFHTDWLNMMYPRMKIARNLLKETGVVLISIDNSEISNLRLACDDVFGGENFIGKLILQTATDNNKTQINTEHEYVLAYGKQLESQPFWARRSEAADRIQARYEQLKETHGEDTSTIQSELRQWIRANEDQLPKVTHYDNVDERGVFHDGDIANTKFGGYAYDIPHPTTGEPCKIPDKGFRFPEDTMKAMIQRGDIMFGVDHTTLIKPKKRLEDAKDALRSIIYEDGRGSTKVVEKLLGRDVFKNPKSHFTLGRIIEFTTGEGDLIVDFFAGSGSTAHAAFEAKIRDGKTRRHILIQLPEPIKENDKDSKRAFEFCVSIDRPTVISEISKERLRRTADLIIAENPDYEGDLGFRVFKLDSSNIKAWNAEAIAAAQSDDEQAALLDEQVDHLLADRTEDDILYELLLKLGLDLCVPIEQREIAGKTVYSVGAGVLMVCLAESISYADSETLAQGIVDWHQELAPATEVSCVFRDSGFTDDKAKANTTAILDQAGLKKVRSI